MSVRPRACIGLGIAVVSIVLPACSFDPEQRSFCANEGETKRGFVCRDGRWVQREQPDAESNDADADRDARSDDGAGEVGETDAQSGLPVGAPCTDDTACRSGRCEQFGGESICSTDCTGDGDCPDGRAPSCFDGECTPSDFCLDPDGDGYGEGPACEGPEVCADCDSNATCETDRPKPACVCNDGWAGDGTDCSRDSDGDGLADDAEASEYGTNPNRADTDLDGLDDGDEVDGPHPTDPTDPDSDGDFLPDGAETERYGSRPDRQDTDGGRRSDGVEVLFFGTDPTDPSDDGQKTPSGEGSAATLVEPRGGGRLINLRLAERAFYQLVPSDLKHFRHDGVIDFASDDPESHGNFRKNEYSTTGSAFWNQKIDNLTAVFSGLLYIPSSRNQSTFAVGSEDGFRLRIATGGSVEEAEMDGERGKRRQSLFGTGPLLRAQTGGTVRAFPFELLWFVEPGNEGVEFSSAEGRRQNFSEQVFSRIEGARIAAPELDSELKLEDANGDDLQRGDSVTWNLEVENQGEAFAWDVWVLPRSRTVTAPTLSNDPSGLMEGQLDFRGNQHDGWTIPVLAPGETVSVELTSRVPPSGGRRATGRVQVVGRASPGDAIDEFRLRQIDSDEVDD